MSSGVRVIVSMGIHGMVENGQPVRLRLRLRPRGGGGSPAKSLSRAIQFITSLPNIADNSVNSVQ
jgi:hypothetical protein